MKVARRGFFRLVGGAAVLPMALRYAFALDYPTRPVRIVVGFPAGTVPDVFARLVAQGLSKQLAQQFIVEDKPGAGANLAASTVSHSSPDGYTLLLVSSSHATNASLYNNLDYNLSRDIAPVAAGMRSPNVLVVTPLVPAKTLPEFIAYAKANPGKLNYASTGNGTATNIAGELFKIMAGVDLVHVPYRGNYLPDLLSGQVQATFTPIAFAIQQIKEGKLRALGVTGATRSGALPGVPAVKEFVPGYEAYIWNGFGVRTGTEAKIIDALNKNINSTLTDQSVKARLVSLGAEPMVMSPAEFYSFIAAETDKWGKIIREARIRVE